MPATNRLHKRLSLFLQAIMVLGLAGALYERQYLTAALVGCIIILTVLPTLLGRRFNVFIPPEFEMVSVGFIFLSLFLGEVRSYYQRFWWWDAVLHTGSGFLLGIFGFLLVYVLNQEKNIQLHMRPAFVALFSFVFAVAIGAVWEIFEFSMDNAFGLNMQKSGLRDTMWDLIVDTVGAFVVSTGGYIYMKRGMKSFVERWIMTFIDTNPHLFSKE